MKAFRLVLVAALVTFTMMGMAQNADRDHQTFDQKMIPLSTISANTDMGYAILSQVDIRALLSNSEQAGMIVAKIRMNGKVLEIYGTYKQWRKFLGPQPKLLPYKKAIKEMKRDD